MARFLTDQTVEMVVEGYVIERHPLEAGIPKGSPVSLILFAIYISGLIQWVEKRDCEVKGLSFVDDVGCVATGCDVNTIVRTLKACTRVSIDWADRRELEFDTVTTKAAPFTRR